MDKVGPLVHVGDVDPGAVVEGAQPAIPPDHTDLSHWRAFVRYDFPEGFFQSFDGASIDARGGRCDQRELLHTAVTARGEFQDREG